ncbi:MAG: amino acid permease [Deltaproteobacteria bacterium]|nr:amino acid permease [Deltaproteobacteria bacterium]
MAHPTAGIEDSVQPSVGNLGTFAGVFTPSVLTILGIILFLRMGYVVGNAGLGKALLIIAAANGISVLTSISLSAIATNLNVKGGGDYYLISRTLGVRYGGAIGIVLFLAQAVSIAFYCIGFGEALTGVLPAFSRLSPRLVAAGAVSFLFIFAWLGRDWATRFQYVVMSLLGLALVSFFWGGLAHWNPAIMAGNWTGPAGAPGFWVLFAILFPAVTGFTQGVSMSGDLKDPGKSLPLGTFCAVGISIAVYFGVAVVFAGALPGPVLVGDYTAMKQAARFGILIDAGVVAATLSSAMASFLGAPRILQSLSADRVFLFLEPFAKGYGPGNNPRRGVILSLAIAYGTIALGNLNVIAPVVSMFFLISYGLLNYATFFEARAASPSFRPRFRWFDYRLSLLGFLACLGAMLAIDPIAAVVAISVLFAIYQYLGQSAGPARWADSRRSYHLQQVRENLLAATAEPEHPRNWRPQILAFVKDETRRISLLRFAAWIQGRSGLTTAVRVLEGSGLKTARPREEAEADLASVIHTLGIDAFPLAVTAQDVRAGMETLVQSFGIGPLKANTILINWQDRQGKGIPGLRDLAYGSNLRMAFRLDCNLVILDPKDETWESPETDDMSERQIHVWWGDPATSQLMLLLAYLMKRDPVWSKAGIRLFADRMHGTEDELRRFLDDARIEAEVTVLKDLDPLAVEAQSAGASLVLLPFQLKGNRIMGPYGISMEGLLPRLGVVAMVLAAGDISLVAEPEEGEISEMAAAFDALSEAQKKAHDAEVRASRALEAAERAAEKLARSVSSAGPGADRETMEGIEKAIAEADAAKSRAALAGRRAVKAKAKATAAAKEAETKGVSIPAEGDETGETSEEPTGEGNG